jgi:putative membrane protein
MKDFIFTLPHVNAILNTTSGLFLIAGFILIRRRRIAAHRASMLAAFVASTVFLVSYVLYHSLLAYYLGQGPTKFKGEGFIRPIYFFILLTHTILAVAVVPFILITLIRGLRRQDEKHRRIARWTYPLWLYVSVTGVIVYLFLYQLYPARS